MIVHSTTLSTNRRGAAATAPARVIVSPRPDPGGPLIIGVRAHALRLRRQCQAHSTLLGKLSVHDQGNGGVLKHMASYAAEDQLAEPRMRVSTHHQQITVKFLGSRQKSRPNNVFDR